MSKQKYKKGTLLKFIGGNYGFVINKIYKVEYSTRFTDAYRFKEANWGNDLGWTQYFVENTNNFIPVNQTWKEKIENA